MSVSDVCNWSVHLDGNYYYFVERRAAITYQARFGGQVAQLFHPITALRKYRRRDSRWRRTAIDGGNSQQRLP